MRIVSQKIIAIIILLKSLQTVPMEKPFGEQNDNQACFLREWNGLPDVTKLLVYAFMENKDYSFIQELLNRAPENLTDAVQSISLSITEGLSAAKFLSRIAQHCFKSKDYRLVTQVLPYFEACNYSIKDLVGILEDYKEKAIAHQEQTAYIMLINFLQGTIRGIISQLSMIVEKGKDIDKIKAEILRKIVYINDHYSYEKNLYEKTPLWHAAFRPNPEEAYELVYCLVTHGADPSFQVNGVTLLQALKELHSDDRQSVINLIELVPLMREFVLINTRPSRNVFAFTGKTISDTHYSQI